MKDMPHFNLNNPKSSKQIKDLFNTRVEKLMRSATITAWRFIMEATPVDTGRARAGWYITVKTPSTQVPPSGKYNVPSLSDHMTNESFTIKDTLYITNNVPYIKALNNGASKKAPARFVEAAVTRVQNVVRKLMKDIK